MHFLYILGKGRLHPAVSISCEESDDCCSLFYNLSIQVKFVFTKAYQANDTTCTVMLWVFLWTHACFWSGSVSFSLGGSVSTWHIVWRPALSTHVRLNQALIWVILHLGSPTVCRHAQICSFLGNCHYQLPMFSQIIGLVFILYEWRNHIHIQNPGR